MGYKLYFFVLFLSFILEMCLGLFLSRIVKKRHLNGFKTRKGRWNSERGYEFTTFSPFAPLSTTIIVTFKRYVTYNNVEGDIRVATSVKNLFQKF